MNNPDHLNPATASEAAPYAEFSFPALARCLAPPVARGSLSLDVADAALLMALIRCSVDDAELLDDWRELQTVLREEVADVVS
jgi:hypothetical protein